MKAFLAASSLIVLLSVLYYTLDQRQIYELLDWKNAVSKSKQTELSLVEEGEEVQHHDEELDWQPPINSSETFSHLAPVSSQVSNTSTPLFWHVVKSGGTSMKAFGSCLRLVVAGQKGSQKESSLEVMVKSGSPFVNVNACTLPGLRKAHDLGFAQSQPAQVIYSPFLRDAIQLLFDETHQARVFALLRHPVDRVVSLFYYLQHATWEKTYDPSLKNMTLLEYANEYPSDNTLVRILTNNGVAKLTNDDLQLAKYYLSQYVLVGLTNRVDESVDRFGQAFGWRSSARWNHCRTRAKKGQNRYEHPQLTDQDEAYRVLANKHAYDIELYEYAEQLFEEQKVMFQ
ncbi:hypothetical protein MPSEU_000305000 [Mayamaea pseudoterrestris]|nr:hypothetical protein MPSEU_000305000 [Mayamaea pseudoterrestris]